MRNSAEQLIFSVEKTIRESGDKLSQSDKDTLEEAVKNAKEKLSKAETVDEIKELTEELSKTANPIFTNLYQNAQAQGGDNNNFEEGESTINVNPDDIK